MTEDKGQTQYELTDADKEFVKQVQDEWHSQRDTEMTADQKVETKNTDDLSNDDMLEVLKRAQKLQNRKNIIKRNVEDDFGKGNVRNQPCPSCGVKLKKCICGFLEKNLR